MGEGGEASREKQSSFEGRMAGRRNGRGRGRLQTWATGGRTPGSGTPPSEGSPRAWRGGRVQDHSGREVKHRSPREELEVAACF